MYVVLGFSSWLIGKESRVEVGERRGQRIPVLVWYPASALRI